MQRNLKTLFSFLKPQHQHQHQHQQWRSAMTKVRLKWSKVKAFDHVIDRDTNVKAAMLLKDAIKRSPTSFITSKIIEDWKKPLGLTFPVLRFLRRYPTLFQEFPHPRYPSLPCFRLTHIALLLDEQEQSICDANELASVETLCRLLMMMKSRKLFLHDLYKLRWDLGLPDRFETRILEKYPDYFRVEKLRNGLTCLSLVQWRDEFAVSALEKSGFTNDHTEFRKGKTNLSFPMTFPSGYGYRNAVKSWMDEFHKLPYVSPYEDCTKLDPNSDVMEKRIVGLLHEFLGLTIHKKTQRNYIGNWTNELVIPPTFTRVFTRYPGIFYLSLKCKTTTVTLKEGYRRAQLINPHPLAKIRKKFAHVMTTGLLYRTRGVNLLTPQDCVLDDTENVEVEEDSESGEEEEYWEANCSVTSDSSD